MDAMVALMIVSLSAILTLQAVQQAHKAAAAADEARRARTVITYVMETGPRSFTEFRGEVAGFQLRLATQTTGLDRPIAVCRRALTLEAPRTGRKFTASTLETCPPEAPS